MKCSQGCVARIVKCLREDNLHKEVIVSEYIGFLSKGEIFYFRGIPCGAPISDHFWWIDSREDELVNSMGPTPRAFSPDSWLEPVVQTTQHQYEEALA